MLFKTLLLMRGFGKNVFMKSDLQSWSFFMVFPPYLISRHLRVKSSRIHWMYGYGNHNEHSAKKTAVSQTLRM